MLRKGQSKRGHTLVGFHAAAASPAPQPMKKLRAGSSHVDPPLRIGQSASPAVQSGTHAAPTTAASGRARPNALAPPPRRPFPSPPDRPPSSATDAANTALLAVHATAAAVAAPIRVAGARGLASSQSGGRSSLARTRRRAGYLAAEADDRDGLGRVPPCGAPAKEPAEAGAIGEAAVLAPAADAHLQHRAEGKTKGRDGGFRRFPLTKMFCPHTDVRHTTSIHPTKRMQLKF